MSTPPMNRAQKRALQRMGAVNAEGAPVRTPRTPPAPKPKEERTTFRQFLREVRGELRKVVWPSRDEVRRYSIIVLITVVLFTTFVALLDYFFGSATLWLYDR
jgi:preprotein translocase subunit SecE